MHSAIETKVAAILEVQKATEAAMLGVINYLKSARQPTSNEAHRIIDTILTQYNCESPEGHIVSSGKQSAEPHETGRGNIAKGVPIVIDIYPRSKKTGYYADMSRTVCIGTPSSPLQKMYNCVLAAQKLAIAMVRPGVLCVDVQSAVDNFFTESGYETSGKGREFTYAEGFVHGVGHGVSKKIHDAPRIGTKSKEILKEGDVITIEPGLYYRNIGGVRIEDLLVVNKTGSKNLTQFSKKLCI
jgi:Xaa-Pro aminopeptidase